MNKCAEVQSLLPWLVNGTLNAFEKMNIYLHLTSCEECRKELVFLQELQERVNQHDEVIFTPSQVDELFMSVMEQIELLTEEQEEKDQSGEAVPAVISIVPISFIAKQLSNLYQAEMQKVKRGVQPTLEELRFLASILQQTIALQTK